MNLWPHQSAAIQAVAKAYHLGQNRVLVKKPTGTGKTVTFASMLKDPDLLALVQSWKPGGGARMLVIAHREELLDQAAGKILAINPGIHVDIEQGPRRASRYADVVVASIQTLAATSYRRLDRLLRYHGHFPIVIVDEAHHAAAGSYRSTLVRLGFLPPLAAGDADEDDFKDSASMVAALRIWDEQAPKDRLLVGVTATPNRSDMVGLGCVFQSIAYSYELKQAIEDGWLVPIHPLAIESETSLDECRTTHGDFNQKDLARAVNNARRTALGLAAWKEHADGASTIAFTVDVAHAHAVAEAYQAAGVSAVAISGETPKDDRRGYLRAYTDGRIQVLANCMVLTEGTDLPRTSCILHLKPTKSATLYEQMTGRGLRIHPGKDRCVVIDVVDVCRRHSLQAAPVLYGLPPGLKTTGDDLRSVAADVDKIRERVNIEAALEGGRYLTLAQLKARAEKVDVWAVKPADQLAGVKLRWLQAGESFRLSYPFQDGTEILTVGPGLLRGFDVAATFRPPEGAGNPRQRTLAQELDTAPAGLQLAESWIEKNRPNVTRIVSSDAAWRSKPASEGQLKYLRALRVVAPPRCTMGHASDLINLAKARVGR